MSIVGPNQGPITPVPSDRPVAANPDRQVRSTSDALTSPSAQLAAQQFGAESSRRGPAQPGQANRAGAQPLNRTGRGQIVNLIV